MTENELVTKLADALERNTPEDRAFFENRRKTCQAFQLDFYIVELKLNGELWRRHDERNFTLE